MIGLRVYKFMSVSNNLLSIYRQLRHQYGHPHEQWGLWCKKKKTMAEKEEVIIGAILTQRTNWRNVELAIASLKRHKARRLKTVFELAKNNPKKLAMLIRSCGFYKIKVGYLKAVAGFFIKNGGVSKISKRPINDLRDELLQLHGVGPETADSILLYALNKPIFVIDEYTRRLARQKSLSVESLSYRHLQQFFTVRLPKKFRLYQDFHALIVVNGKQNSKNS